MAYPNGCTRAEKQLICGSCDLKQQQACKDNHEIVQAKQKKYKGRTNAEIAALNNETIIRAKYQNN